MPSEEAFRHALQLRHGKELQERFSHACVAVCGLGGLGSHIAMALARAGIGKLHLIDFDRVELSNLNRQQYNTAQIGMRKTEALRENLLAAMPYCAICTDYVRMTAENTAALLAKDDIVCEAFDAPECKAMLVHHVLEAYPEKYVIAASGMAGLHSSNSIRTKRITSHLYVCGDGESDVAENHTLFASRAMLCAAHQANAVLRIIAGISEK